MNKLLILPLLALASCAPALQAVSTVTGAVKGAVIFATLDHGDVLVSSPGPGPLHGDESKKGQGVAVTVDGDAAYTPDAEGLKVCKQFDRPGRYSCNLGSIAEGVPYRLKTGAGKVLDVQGFGYLGKSPIPRPIVLRK